MPTVHDCRILQFPQIRDPRGALTPIEGGQHVPFDIKRIYYLYGISAGASRAGHSHKDLQQVLIAVTGSFDVHLDDGRECQTISLSRPDQGLFIPRMIWREIHHFSEGAVCVALASEHYDEGDYYRDHADFLRACGSEA